MYVIPTKVCRKCNQEKMLCEFYLCRALRSNICSTCTNAKNKKNCINRKLTKKLGAQNFEISFKAMYKNKPKLYV